MTAISSKSSSSSSLSTSSWLARILFLFCTLSLFQQVASQEEQLCACSPSIFTFKLDFNATCPPENVITGKETGIDAVFCQVAVEPLQGYSATSKSDLTPVSVSQISVFELDSQLSVIKQSFLSGLSLEDGDYYTYSSIIGEYNNNPRKENEIDNIPGGLQVLLKGKNDKGVSISNSFILTYTNRCDVAPFSAGNSIGWNGFVGIEPPPYQLCPLYSPFPTNVPSFTPTTVSPTLSPTIAPTLPPTIISTVSPTLSPTIAPTLPPFITPTASPTSEILNTSAPISITLEPTEDIVNEKPSSRPSDTTLSFDYNWLFYEVDFNNNDRKRNRRKLLQQKEQKKHKNKIQVEENTNLRKRIR